ncbi:MAG: hypothetical protein KGL68_08325 [Burkholderiales bacterium]|nr:hypothetical protein [Burkholderiales bacterium]
MQPRHLPDRRPATARSGLKRGALAFALAASTLLLAACGGGTDNVTLGINAVVGGQPLTATYVPGTLGTIDLVAGQSIELDATEPVDWAFSVDGSPLFGNGTTVYYGGLAITETAVSPSRVVIDTAVTGPYVSPVVIGLSATSTIDAALVANIDLVVH